jgi:peptidoglycan/xylan/chitin deacetylase (PgdA/CDA1 family)
MAPDTRYALSWKGVVELPEGFLGKSRKLLRDQFLKMLAAITSIDRGNFARAIYCHYVFDDQVIDFKSVIRKLKNIGEFLNTEDYFSIKEEGYSRSGRFFHLSFDDGFKNNYTNAAPILIDNKVPAVFFVPTGYIGADFQKSSYYCKSITRYRDVVELMSEADIKSLSQAGFEIGSHTINHVRLNNASTSQETIRRELLLSKKAIELWTGRSCKYLAWPFGGVDDFDLSASSLAKEVGFEGCFGGARLNENALGWDRFNIVRNHFELEWGASQILFFAAHKIRVENYI